MTMRSFLFTLGSGAAVMYFFDPVLGRRRQALWRDQGNRLRRQTRNFFRVAEADTSNRARGLVARISSFFQRRRAEITAERPLGAARRDVRLSDVNWSPTLRLVAGTTGVALVLNALRRPTLGTITMGVVGAGLTVRALSNMEIRRLVGAAGPRGIDLQKTITVDAPVAEVYDLWTNFESFPHFMSNVLEVRDLGNGRTHWTVAGPLGTPVQWDAVTTREVPNEVIAWQTGEGSPVAHAGVVRFEPTEEGKTRLTVHMTYSPPAGAAGHLVASLFGADPKRQMDEDLMRMKSFVETGVAPHDRAVAQTEAKG